MKQMSLDLELVYVSDVRFGSETKMDDHVLYVNREELISVAADRFFSSVDVELARPGESIRIIPVKDVIEPRIKPDTGDFFPGILGGFEGVGEGRTRVLKGCGVVTTGQIVCFQEGLIDMSGPCADYCIYSKMNNVVLIAEPVEGITPEQHEEAVRLAGVRMAHYLAKAAVDVEADEVKTYTLPPVLPEKKLPRLLYVNLVLAQGLLHDNYIYGGDCKKVQTALMHPNEMMDGAIVSGNCVTACDKNTTYDHENNPVVEDMYARHGVDLEFLGVISSPTTTMLAEKERGVMAILSIARLLSADGIVVTEEGGGNPEADLMLIAEKAEKAGIKCVLVLHENAGDDGASEPLSNTSAAAKGVVTAGNNNEFIVLPPMEKVLGHLEAVDVLAGGVSDALRPDGSVNVRLAVIMDATSNLGITKISAETY